MRLRSFSSFVLPVAAFALFADGVGIPVHAQKHAPQSVDHSHHHAEAAATDRVVGPFATDAPLRAGMSRVRESVESLAALTVSSSVSVAKGGANETRVLTRTAEIQSAIESIFAECRLPPDADAALHPMLADLLQASAALKDAPSARAPIAQMQGVMTRYDAQFQDEGAGDWDHH